LVSDTPPVVTDACAGAGVVSLRRLCLVGVPLVHLR
jgi:hypothetical protein